MRDLRYTKRRGELRDAIAAGKVYGYAWAPMQAFLRDGTDERFVAGQVREFLKHGLARWKWGGTGEREPIVLTQDGEAWPGSTSPEPGPEPLAEAPTLTQIVEYFHPGMREPGPEAVK